MPDRLSAPEFHYRTGVLHAEDVALPAIAARVGTPFYCYSQAGLVRSWTGFATALSHLPATICYALKANSNLAVIRVLSELGAGADVVSEGELRRALAAGVPAEKIVFSGVGKTRAEMRAALEAGILQINVESEPELEALSEVATALGTVAPVSIRVNPDVDAGTHEKISTGRKQDKFGIPFDRLPDVYERAATLPGTEPVGVAVHIGSQLLVLDPYRDAFLRVAGLVRTLRAAGHTVRRVDLGGGIGITYRDEVAPHFEDYAALVGEIFGELAVELVFEPGRALVGNAGILVSTVLYVKEGAERPIVIVDAAMNDLKRPAMYGAYHAILPIAEAEAGAGVDSEMDVAGPVCESGDTFATRRSLPPLASGDLVAFGSAGAYGAVMASTYNSRLLVPEVLVSGSDFSVVRARPTYEDMLALDTLPPWLRPGASQASRGAA